MAYNAFTDGKPVGTDTGLEAIDYMRENLMALRDAVVAGAMAGWDYAPSGGTADEPATVTYSKSTERIRGSITWGSSGGADGNPTEIVWEYSSDSGSTWDAIGTESITYDASANVTAVTWS